MTRYTGPVPPMPIVYKRDWNTEAIIAVGVLAVAVGALLILGAAVIL